MFKIIKNETPSYLNDLLPSLVNIESNYNLRNNTNYELPFCRLCSYEKCYFPSILKLWNDLNTETRNIPTIQIIYPNSATQSRWTLISWRKEIQYYFNKDKAYV